MLKNAVTALCIIGLFLFCAFFGATLMAMHEKQAEQMKCMQQTGAVCSTSHN